MDINEILDKNYEEVKRLVDNIRSSRCPNCGADKSEGKVCLYCRTENKELIDNITRIENILKTIVKEMKENNISIKDMPINKLCNSLCTLSHHSKTLINNFLEECNYKSKLYTYLREELSKLGSNDYEITDFGQDSLESLIYMNPKDIKIEDIHKLVIIMTLIHKPPVSYECFVENIVHFIKDLTYKNNHIATVELIENNSYKDIDTGLEKRVLGSNTGCIVRIDTLGISELYKYGNPEVLITIYHEICHYYQQEKIGKLHDRLSIIELKDEILSKYINNYYKQNYNLISFEHEAEYTAIKRLIYFMQQFKLTFNKDIVEQKQNEHKKQMHITNRIINEEEVDINEYFDEFIASKPELLEKYPILKDLYEVKDGMVIPVDSRTITR